MINKEDYAWGHWCIWDKRITLRKSCKWRRQINTNPPHTHTKMFCNKVNNMKMNTPRERVIVGSFFFIIVVIERGEEIKDVTQMCKEQYNKK